MPRKDRIDAAGAAMLVGFAALLAVNQVMIKVVNTGLQPVFYAGLRSGLAMLCLLVWFRLKGRSLRVAPEARGAALLMGLVFAAEFLLLFLALDLTTVVRTSIIFYSMPVWLALMAHFGLGPAERITRGKALGLVCAFAGTAWAIADGGSRAGEASLVGDLCALGAAMCWAGTAYLARGTSMVREGPDMQLLCMVAVSALVLLLLAPAFGPLVRDLVPLHLWFLLFQSVVVVAAGFMFWLWLLTIYPAAGVASFSFLTPILGLGFGWLILGEPIGPGILGAGALVAAGILLINRRPADATVQR
jgi:drug/metabolite transporter (DMT)-like permease